MKGFYRDGLSNYRTNQRDQIMEKIRSFVAILLSDEIKNKTGTIIDELWKSGAQVSWVSQKNLHFTIKFLGYVDEKQLNGVNEALQNTSDFFSTFKISISGVGAFPNFKYPRIIWVGMSEGSSEILGIQRHIDGLLSKIGFPPENRIFRPHITIGRVKGFKNIQNLREIIEKINADDIGFQMVDKISLMKSDLHPQGAIYTELSSYSLSREGIIPLDAHVGSKIYSPSDGILPRCSLHKNIKEE